MPEDRKRPTSFGEAGAKLKMGAIESLSDISEWAEGYQDQLKDAQKAAKESSEDKGVFGVISSAEDSNSEARMYSNGVWGSGFKKENSDDNRLFVNSLGEGAIWVSNYNGNLENGDYITSSSIEGIGMKQDDDLLHNYTVAKITQDCYFDMGSDSYDCVEIEHEGSIYKKAFVGCTYHCG